MELEIVLIIICIIVALYLNILEHKTNPLPRQLFKDSKNNGNKLANEFSFYGGPNYECFDQEPTDVQKDVPEPKLSDLPDLTKQQPPQIAPMEYSENNYKYNIFDGLGSLGDNIIAHHMKHVSNKNRVAIDNFARQNKNTNINYLKGELDEHANSIWWDNDELEQEMIKQ